MKPPKHPDEIANPTTTQNEMLYEIATQLWRIAEMMEP